MSTMADVIEEVPLERSVSMDGLQQKTLSVRTASTTVEESETDDELGLTESDANGVNETNPPQPDWSFIEKGQLFGARKNFVSCSPHSNDA